MKINKIYQGHTPDILKSFPDDSIDCVITSPPYWSLRDYKLEPQKFEDGWEGQLGLEPTFKLYLKHLIQIFDEVKRVLKPTGTCWVNLGDSYNGSGGCGWTGLESKNWKQKAKPHNIKSVPRKSLCAIPERFKIMMIDRGWICRNTIIWHKRNCMPSSASDRFTVDFEYVHFFVKNQKYWFEQQFEPHLIQKNRPHGVVRNREYNYQGKYKVPYSVQPRNKNFIEIRNLPKIKEFSLWLNNWRKQQKITIDEIELKMKSQAPHHWFNGESFPTAKDWDRFKDLYNPPKDYDKQLLNISLKSAEKQSYPQGRNKRCVWDVTTQPYSEAHFATFPEKLVEPMIRSGCHEDGIVCDIFAGSGTTFKVAKRLRRNWIGIELNPEYIEMAKKRIKHVQMELLV